jgi:hypothetical protein
VSASSATAPTLRQRLRAWAIARTCVALHFVRDGHECIAIGVVVTIDAHSVRIESPNGSYCVPVQLIVHVEPLAVTEREEPAS